VKIVNILMLCLSVLLLSCSTGDRVVSSVDIKPLIVGNDLQVTFLYYNAEGKLIHPQGKLSEGWIAYEGKIKEKTTTAIIGTDKQVDWRMAMYFLDIHEYTESIEIPIRYLTESNIDISSPISIQVNIDGIRQDVIFQIDKQKEGHSGHNKRA